MVKTYASASDVQMKLHRSIIFYDSFPHFVECKNIDDPNWKMVRLTPLRKSATSFEVAHDDEKIDTSAPSLGYFNWRNTAHYLYRIPSRVQNQGLRSDNIRSVTQSLGGSFFATNEFGEFLMKKYPKLKTAENMLESLAWTKVAIHPQFAIGLKEDLTLGLYHQEKLIGSKNSVFNSWSISATKSSPFINKILAKSRILLND